VVERVEDLAELEAQQEPVIVRRVFKNPASAPRTSVTKTTRRSEPFSIGVWFKTAGGEQVIYRDGTIRVGGEDEPDSQGR
jgi:hypothetical protein